MKTEARENGISIKIRNGGYADEESNVVCALVGVKAFANIASQILMTNVNECDYDMPLRTTASTTANVGCSTRRGVVDDLGALRLGGGRSVRDCLLLSVKVGLLVLQGLILVREGLIVTLAPVDRSRVDLLDMGVHDRV